MGCNFKMTTQFGIVIIKLKDEREIRFEQETYLNNSKEIEKKYKDIIEETTFT